jgi:hypothetical protein
MYNTVRTIKPMKKTPNASQAKGPVTNSYMGNSLTANHNFKLLFFCQNNRFV